MPLPLEGKVAIVTGSSRGIGQGIALCLAQEGADVVVGARSDNAAANPLGTIERTAAEVRALGRRALSVKLDVTSDDEVRAAIDATMREFGRIDILVNNAGILGRMGDYWGGSPDVIDAYYRTNLRAPYVITQLVAPLMEAQGGGVVFNISSAAARFPEPPGPGWQPAPGRVSIGYGMTKVALNRWVVGVAGELMLHKVAIIALDPGLTVVERNLADPRPGVNYDEAQTPEYTGRAVTFLAQNPMPYTGQTLESAKVVAEHGLTITGMRPTL